MSTSKSAKQGIPPRPLVHHLACTLDENADLPLSEGQIVQAERLAERAAEVRESAL